MLFKVQTEKMPVLCYGFGRLQQHLSVVQQLHFPSSLTIPFKLITEIGNNTGTAMLSQYEQNTACIWPILPEQDKLRVILQQQQPNCKNQINQFKLISFWWEKKERTIMKLYL